MEGTGPTPGGRRRFRRWRIALTAILVFAVAGLLISGNWLRGRVTRMIHQRTGLETRIGPISWTPWSGLSARQVELLQPPPLRPLMDEPLVRIECVTIQPVWRAWLRGNLEVRSVTLDSPRVVLPVELLSHLARPATPTVPPPPQPVPAAEPPPPDVAVATPDPAAAVPYAAPPASPRPAAPPAPPVVTPPPTGWIHLKNASFRLLLAGGKRELLEISNITGDLPVSGAPARSKLTVGSVSLPGANRLTDLHGELEWRQPVLSLKPAELSSGPFHFRFASKLAMLPGLPLQIEASLPEQPLPEFPLPFQGRAAAKALAADARFRGLLLSPPTWHGDFVARATGASVKAGPHDGDFEKGSAVVVLRGGILSCPDARLTGEQLSLLGNATILADGRLAGAARLVAPPDVLSSIAGRVFPNIASGPSLTPLSTPQRSAFDLEAVGNPGQILLRLGRDGPVVELKP